MFPDQAVVLALRDHDLIIEVHDFVHAGTGELLAARLAATHRIASIPCVDDAAKLSSYQYEELQPFRHRQRLRLLAERRPEGTHWLCCSPKNVRYAPPTDTGTPGE